MLKLYELDFLHGTVLNVAHGMIAICIHACTRAAPAYRQSSTRGALALDSVAMLQMPNVPALTRSSKCQGVREDE
jgi:hypothetical protein